MKRDLFLILFIFLGISARTQYNSIEIFTQEPERFSVVLNGILQNTEPQTSVTMPNIKAQSYKLKIIFDNPRIPDIKKSVYLEPGIAYTYEIKKNKKGAWVLAFAGQDMIRDHATQNDDQPYVMPGYNGPYGCHRPMKEHDFDAAKETIRTKDFESSKLTIAKQIASSNCLFSSQVKEIMQLFSFEESKIDFAKYAYHHTLDQGNYFKVNDAFTFESSIEELNRYIGDRH